jgi:hypothetical protein
VRTPSETLRLEWTDIYWDVSKFKVTSPKTEHHEGKAERLVPIFPELLPYLREAFEQAPEGARYVINRTRDPKVNWRTRLLKIIRRAGLTPWPKPFQNMRATRETELADEYPAHVVTAWIGNSERVATDHYLQITEEHWKSAAESGAVALQKAVQQGVSPTLTESQDLTQVLANCDSVRDGERICDIKEHARRDSNPQPLGPKADINYRLLAPKPLLGRHFTQFLRCLQALANAVSRSPQVTEIPQRCETGVFVLRKIPSGQFEPWPARDAQEGSWRRISRVRGRNRPWVTLRPTRAGRGNLGAGMAALASLPLWPSRGLLLDGILRRPETGRAPQPRALFHELAIASVSA